MSKNVAVFVDVANIFYAAKAAGVDIDYVTLLKSATAGRDMVRAYAYTGLDPENENQRQFHSFLSRSGYKVVSKDIRKYGDGRIKANLDIELVVDMMRMATHLDIAVVISGDGDFAPAIRAVQQMGVRVEVISFRGNTSSDLIEVADVFVDITQVARVEKGARSGRRVAAEGDLSMTEVPDKETEGATRRRRTPRRAPEREVAAIVPLHDVTSGEADALPGNVIVLPGERLSKAASVDEDLGDRSAPESDAAGEESVGTIVADGDMETDADGRRRRRRRGGRGRGRGRREEGQEGQPDAEGQPATTAGQSAAVERQSAAVERQAMIEPAGAPAMPDAEVPEDDEEFLDEVPVAIPQHSTFGSVWDTQLGVPAAPLTGTSLAQDEEDLEEPEIPEYLLAERRQQQQRNRGGRSVGGGGNRGGRGGGSYRTALDRERFGRSGVSSFGGGGAAAGNMGSNMSRPPDRQRGREQRLPAPNRQGRPPMREPAQQQPSRQAQQAPRPAQDAEPWSEVPAEVQALLRAELARRSGRPEPSSERSANETQAPSQGRASAEATGPTEATGPLAEEPQQGQQVQEAPTATPARKRAPRTTSRGSAASARAASEADEGEAGAEAAPRAGQAADTASAGPQQEAETSPARPRATRARRTATAGSEPAQGATADGEPEAAQPAPKRRATRKVSAAAADSSPTAQGETPAEDAPKPRKRATRKAPGTGAAEGTGSGEPEDTGTPQA
ncbi:MAG: NYN domain-containing protein [Chloroflexi bacterium]|nr:NYN domain-containing protein [Chloroflexota bacterium]